MADSGFLLSRKVQMSHFSSEAVKIAVAELLRMHGADKTSVAAHQVFVDITERYMRLLAKTAQNYAEHSGRTQVNIFDVIDCFRLLNIQVSPMEDYLKSITAQKHKMLEKVKGLAAKNNIDVDEELVVPFAFPRLEPCSYPIRELFSLT